MKILKICTEFHQKSKKMTSKLIKMTSIEHGGSQSKLRGSILGAKGMLRGCEVVPASARVDQGYAMRYAMLCARAGQSRPGPRFCYAMRYAMLCAMLCYAPAPAKVDQGLGFS